MRTRGKVTLLKSGNRLVCEPSTPQIQSILIPKLTFQEMVVLRGPELQKEKRRAAEADEKPRTVRWQEWECWTEDIKGRVATSFGFWKRMREALVKAGYEVRFRDLTPHPRPEVFEPRWERLKEFGIKLRAGQDEFLRKLIANRCGRFGCPPGYGKSFLMGVAAIVLPKARIDIASRSVSVVRDRIFPDLCRMIPDVGIVGGGKNKPGHRVMCYTIDSMHKASADADILFGDECHQFAPDKASQRCARWDNSRNFGLSATQDMRLDKKDFRVEAIFGPLLYEIPYEDAEKAKLVAKMKILWRSVVMTANPCRDAEDPVEKNRLGIWTNDFRNDLIAQDAAQYDDDTQVIVYCDTLIHAVHLKSRLPHFTLVYREDTMTRRERNRYIAEGLITEDEPYMDSDRREKLTRRITTGKLKKVICTTVFNAGVNFPDLAVLVRADGGGSQINDTQVPGRASRRTDYKDCAIIHDYMDQFDRGMRTKALSRQHSYEANKWENVFPGRPKTGSFRQTYFWEFED